MGIKTLTITLLIDYQENILVLSIEYYHCFEAKMVGGRVQ